MRSPTNLNVSLTSRLMDLVRDRVKSGRYQSASEVVREGLRLLEERDERSGIDWSEVRGKVAEARAEMKAGMGIPADVFRENMSRFTRELKAERTTSKPRRRGRKS